MDDETRELIKKSVELGEANRRALDKLLRYQKNVQIFAALKWMMIVLSAVGAFYYLQPFWERLWSTYNSLVESFSTVNIRSGGLPL